MHSKTVEGDRRGSAGGCQAGYMAGIVAYEAVFIFSVRLALLVIGEGDVVILKTIKKPSMNEFISLVAKARKQSRISGMKRSDIVKAIARVRRRM